MVRPASKGAALASAGRPAPRSLCGVAVGNHVAADRGQNGRALFCEIPGALERCGGAWPRLARRRVTDVGRAWILLARAQSARLRGVGAARSWRGFSRYRRRLAVL